jgi:uncharacterized protein (DUF3820 family)
MIVVCLLFSGVSCSSVPKSIDPLGKPFPKVGAEKLSKQLVNLPDEFIGEQTIVLIGFVQDSQFDIDRWMLGLRYYNTDTRVVEIPTIRGVIPRLISSYIDNGMRSGIPREDWSSVMTVYEDANKIADFVGTQNELNARVLLLDPEGRVEWFHDRGFSAGKLFELVNKINLHEKMEEKENDYQSRNSSRVSGFILDGDGDGAKLYRAFY